jgi:two-component system cell cycle sensor histidine kinase/response regulator CckA
MTPIETSDAFFRRLVEYSTDLTAVLSADGRVEYVSPSIVALLGYQPDAIGGQSITALIHPDDVAPTIAAIDDEMNGRNQLWYLEVRVRSALGEWIPLEVKGRRDPEATAPHIIIHARDLRERYRVETQLRDQCNWSRALLEASPAAIITLDTSLVITSWNAAAERLFGWSAHEVVGGPLPTMPSDTAEATASMHAMLHEAKSIPQSYQTRRVRRDGRVIDVEVSLAPIRAQNGTVAGVIKLASDITAQKAMERQLRASEQFETTGRLAGGIAHDFNNLLGTIMTSAGLLVDELPAGTDAHEDAAAIIAAVRRAGALTRQLLTLARRKSPQTTRLELPDLVASLESSTREAVPNVLVTFARVTGGIEVIADPDDLREAVRRLITNAIEAMPTGGTLSVETQRVTLPEGDAATARLAAGDYAMVAVSDSGVGMSPEVLENCFAPYFTTKQQKSNPGLGLATVFAIARQCAGGIAASSAVGIGTTMRLYLPLVSDPSAERVTPPRAHEPLVEGASTILLVEDDHTFRAVVRRALESQGYHVLDAAGGVEALSAVDRHRAPIELLVTDLVMPDIAGNELAKRLRVLRPQLRVLYMSGYGADVLRDRGGLQSHEAFIQKPFTPSDFVGAVKNLFDVLS